jgi:enoyl-CoA hydratase/carnithine racemase
MVLFERSGFIGQITLNDPDRRNALGPAMADAFHGVVEKVRQDQDLRCVILTGAGSAFSAGGDMDMIDERMQADEESSRAYMTKFYGAFLCLCDIEVPTIAFINGHAIGAGFCLALACDLRIASDKAKMSGNFVKLGLSPGMGATWFISQLTGPQVAADLLLTGRIIQATEAHEMGLVHQVHPSSQARQEVDELATQIASNSPVGLRETKRVLRANSGVSLQDALKREAQGQAFCFGQDDVHEGVAAIRERRKPKF